MKLIMLGAPGAGKGTYASRIKNHFHVPHISTGDLFRENIERETELGKKAKGFIDAGQLVPDEITINMLKSRISQEDCVNGFILDGFPRTIAQAEALDEITTIDKVVNILVPDEVVIERLSSRRYCKDCGEIYNLRTNLVPKVEGKCDKCGGEVIQRDDDKPETIRKRLATYKEKTKPLEEYYRKKGILVDVVNNQVDTPVDEFTQFIISKIEV